MDENIISNKYPFVWDFQEDDTIIHITPSGGGVTEEELLAKLATINLTKVGDLTYNLFVNGNKQGEINIPKDQFLKNVTYKDGVLTFVFETSEGEKTIDVDISDIVKPYKAGNGIDITDDNEISAKIDSSSDTFLSISSEGIKVSGIQSALDTKADVSDTYNMTQVDDMLALKADKENVYTKDAVDTELEKKADAETTYTKTEVDGLLNVKADAADVYTIAQTDGLLEGKANVGVSYTKAQEDALLDTKADEGNVYNKTEIDGFLNEKADAEDVYTKDEVDTELGKKADAETTYTKDEVDGKLADKADAADVYTKDEVDTELGKKQDGLVSGTNIKTINGKDILGEGNMEVGTMPKLTKVADYLYSTSYDVLDYEYAKDFFENHDPLISIGGCSSMRSGNFFGRNLDWFYNNNTDFFVRTPNRQGRKAVIGISGGLKITDAEADNGVEKEEYKIMPFYLQDGINEDGVFCNINVMPVKEGEYVPTTPLIEERERICTLMLPRYILDKFSTATDAVEYIRDYVSLFTSQSVIEKGYELHAMVGDAEKTYVIEPNGTVLDIDEHNFMTNFHIHGITPNADGKLYTNADVAEGKLPTVENHVEPYGSGLERYNAMVDAFEDAASSEGMVAAMKSIFYTKTYGTEEPIWYSECADREYKVSVDTPVGDEKLEYIRNYLIDLYNNRSRNNPVTWQTTHSSVYDIDKKSLIVHVQEDGEHAYEFSFKGDYTPTELDLILNQKADKVNTYTKTEVDGLLVGKADAATTYSKTEVNGLLGAKADADTVYTKTETDNLLGTKADTANVYDKTQIDGFIDVVDAELDKKADVKDVYTKTEIEGKLAEKQGVLTAGSGIDITNNVISSTLDVTLYRVVNVLPTEGIESNKIYLIPDEGETELGNVYTEHIYVNGAWEELGKYKSTVDLTPYLTKSDAADTYLSKTDAEGTYQPKGDYATNTDLSLKANSADVYTKTEVYNKTECNDALETKADVSTVETLNGRVSATEGDIAMIKTTEGQMQTDITNLGNSVTALDTKVDGFGTSLNAKANAADVYTKTEVDTKLDGKQDKVTCIKTIDSVNFANKILTYTDTENQSQNVNITYTNASANTDGLMSYTDYNNLQSLLTKVADLESRVAILEGKVNAVE